MPPGVWQNPCAAQGCQDPFLGAASMTLPEEFPIAAHRN